MSHFIKAVGVNPPASRPVVLVNDELLPAKGALLLLDAAPADGNIAFPAGIPTSGVMLTNLAAGQASALMGEDSLDPALSYDITGAGGTFIERSKRGGLHVSLAPTPDASQYAVIRFPQKVLNYLAANPQHDIYVSLWNYRTRFSPVSSHSLSGAFLGATASTSQVLYAITNDGAAFPDAASQLAPSHRNPAGTWIGTPAAQPLYASIGSAQNTGTAVTTPPTAQSKIWGMGAAGPIPHVVDRANAGTSDIFYRYYMEDLTVSGRTYAQVDAKDWAMFQRDVLKSGGRYYGDTYTKP